MRANEPININLLEHIQKVLHQPLDGINFENLVTVLGEPSENLEMVPGKRKLITFNEYGFYLHYDVDREEFYSVAFLLDTVSIQKGQVTAYAGQLPLNILSTDSPDEIRSKLSVSPTTENFVSNCSGENCRHYEHADFSQTYELPQFHLALVFENNHSGLKALELTCM